MVRQAQRQNPQRKQVSIGTSVPAPIGGWDTQSPLAAMPPQNALILDNWVPRTAYVELRRGYIQQVTNFGPVESMMAYRAGSGGDKLFACASGSIYDVTTAGPLGAAVSSGYTSNRWNYTAFATTSGPWIVACNGADAPIGYNAGAWGPVPALTFAGPPTLDPTKMANVFSHKGRLYFLEKDSLHVWCPAAAAVGGACSLVDLTSVFSKGGRLIAGANWSFQFGVTNDDFAVFVTDQGQVAIYQGTDPTNAATWSLLSVYDFGPPLGPKALLKFGGDLAIVTSDGVIPLSQGLSIDRTQQTSVAMTSKIMGAFSAAVRAYSANYGWQGILYPGIAPTTNTNAVGGTLAIFNVPISTLGLSMQFVQNILTGAWCRFLNINAFCWETANGGIYFGSTAGVYQWDQGSSDNGVAIVGDVKPAWNAFGYPGRSKQFKMIRPLMFTSASVMPALDVDVDYQESAPTASPTVVGQGAATQLIRYDWTSVGSIGYVAAPRMQVNLKGDVNQPLLAVGDANGDLLAIDNAGDNLLINTSLPFDAPCQLLAFDVLFELGGQIG